MLPQQRLWIYFVSCSSKWGTVIFHEINGNHRSQLNPHKKGRQLYSPYFNFILIFGESVALNKEFTDSSPRQDNLSCSPPNRKRTNKYTPKPLKEKRRTEKGKRNKYQLQETLFTSDTKCRLLLSSTINTTPVFSPF